VNDGKAALLQESVAVSSAVLQKNHYLVNVTAGITLENEENEKKFD